MNLMQKYFSDDVKKPSALVHFERSLSPQAQKIMTIVVFVCQTAKPRKDGFYYVRKSFVKNYIGWKKSKNYEGIYNAFDEIYENSIVWNFTGVDRTFKKMKSRLITSLPEPDERKGKYFAFKINPDLEPVIKDPRVFAKFKLVMLAILVKPKYAYSLYEFFADCYSRGASRPRLPLKTIKDYLGIPQESYKTWIPFKKEVLQPCLKKINEFSDLKVFYETYREGRVIGGLTFDIGQQSWQQPIMDILISELQTYYQEEEKKPTLLEMTPKTNLEERAFIDNVAIYRISEKNAIKAIKKHGLKGVNEIKDYVLRRAKKDKKMDIGAYMAKCLDQGFGIKTPEEREKEKEDKKNTEKLEFKKQRKEIFKSIESQVRSQRKDRFIDKKEALKEKELKQYKAEFESGIEAGEYGNDLKKAFKVTGEESNKYKMSLHFFLQSKLLPPEIEELRKFSKEKGFDYDELKAEFGS